MSAFTRNTYRAVAVTLFFFQAAIAEAQVVGCKDPAATNYNPAATVADSSCTYNPTFYTPPVKIDPLNATLAETSGLQWAGNSLWTINDGGGLAVLYRIDTSSNTILQTVTLDGAGNVDWEDLTFDGTNFYIGDFGNNNTGIRTDLKIYKFPLSAIPDYVANATVTVPSTQIEVINFSYSNQTDFTTPTTNNTKFDCEAMIVDGGAIHLFTKDWVEVKTTHYIINSLAAGTYSATPVETLNTGYLVTAANKVPGFAVIALLGYQNGLPYNHYMHLMSDFSGGYYFNGNRRRIDLPDASVMGQAEGLTFRTPQYGYISSERITYGPFTINQKLRSFNTANFVPAYVLPLDLSNFTVQKLSGEHVINWRFAAPVNNLRILHSSDGVRFTGIKDVGTSAGGSATYKPGTATNCYKLVWQQPAGGQKFSDIVCVDEKAKAGISKVVLRKTGELSFTASQADEYVLRLIATDGKLLAQTTQRIAPGFSTVRFSGTIPDNAVILVQINGAKNQFAQLMRVGE